jgi:predicted amidophosphoribosyltransferase
VAIALALSKAMGIPIRPLLRRTWRPWTAFKRLNRAGRKILAVHAFRLRRDLNGETVLLVDDLMTTGSTLLACSRRCTEAGASEIHGLVWAKTVSFLI